MKRGIRALWDAYHWATTLPPDAPWICRVLDYLGTWALVPAVILLVAALIGWMG